MKGMVKRVWAKLFTCPKCGYTWIPRVKNPKECPRCRKRLD